MAEFVFFIGDLALIAAAVGATVFAVSYATFFNWRITPAGRALMYFVLSLVAVFAINTIATLFGPAYPFREYVRLAVYVAVALATWRLVLVLWRNWRADLPPFELSPKTRSKE